MIFKKYLFFLTLLLCGMAMSQTPPPLNWKYTYGGPEGNDNPQAIEKTADGGFILVGHAGDVGCEVSQGQGGWVVKLDANGILLWEKTIIGNRTLYNIRQTADGGYITMTFDGALVVFKLDANGNVVWQQNYAGGYFRGLWQANDGSYLLAGSDAAYNGANNIRIYKLDANGNIIWQHDYGGSGMEKAMDIKQTTDGGYIVFGETNSTDGDVQQNHGGTDLWVLKLFPDGTLDWEKTYGGSNAEGLGGFDYGNDFIRQTADGGYVFVGNTQSTDGDLSGSLYGLFDVWVVKLHPNGAIDWEKNYGGSSVDYGSSIKQTLDGGYIVGAVSQSSDFQVNKNEGLRDVWFFKVDSMGNILWDWSLGSIGQERVTDIEQVSGCEYVVAASANHASGDVSNTCSLFGGDFWIINFKRSLNPPLAASPQNFCWRQQPVIDSLDVQGDNTLGFPVSINWYDDKNDVYALPGNTLLANGEKYYVTQTIDGCESPMDSVVVNIAQDILPTAASPQSFCEDDNVHIASIQVNGQNLLWYQDPNANTPIPANTLLEDGKTYYVSQAIDNCESSLLPIAVEVFPPPDVFPVPNVVACDTDGNGEGEFYLPDLDDDVSGGAGGVNVTYHANLSDAENGTNALLDNYTIQNSSESIYARVLDTVTGCDSIVEIELMFSPVPEIADVEDLYGCDDGNGEAVFDLSQNNENVLGNQNPNGLSISYHESQPDADSGDNAIPNPENYTSGPKPVFVRLESTGTDCYDMDSFELFVDPRPNIDDTPIALEVCSDEEGGNTAVVDLTQFDTQINPASPANTMVVYYANANEHTAGNSLQNPESYVAANNQIILAETFDTQTNCPSSTQAEITIRVNDRPLVDLDGSRVICWDSNLSTPVEGGNYEPIVLETGLDENEYTFEWILNGESLPETGPSLEATEPGEYEVVVSDTDGTTTTCTSTANVTVNEANPPEFSLSRLSGAVDSEHSILVSEVSGIGNFVFRLDDGEWLPLNNDGTLVFKNVPPGMHTVYGRSLEGCGTTIHTITLIGYPRFFTPNNDGQNDRWNIIGLQEGEVYIFDRYGKLLASLNPNGAGWDGNYNGQRMPSDDYWFKVEFVEKLPDGTEKAGEFAANFSLIR